LNEYAIQNKQPGIVPPVSINISRLIYNCWPEFIPGWMDSWLPMKAKLGLTWDTGLMTTGQAALYSVYIDHTEHYSFGGSHEYLFPTSREEVTIVFLSFGRVRHLHGADAGPEFQPFL
jgi:hypothetical protein